MARRILFTGGGTAGHVTPNIALIERLFQDGWDIEYVGSRAGIERELIEPLGIRYHGILSGKLRRYFSWQNFIDPFLIFFGFLEACLLCARTRPQVIFSKGGFVAVPVVAAGFFLRIPVISHESDMTPGLANRLAAPFSRYVCVTFPQAARHFAADKVRYTGSPVRRVVTEGQALRGRTYLGFHEDKPIVLIVGGSLGARAINEVIWKTLPDLLVAYQVVHMVGRGAVRPELQQVDYVQKAFIGNEYGDVLAAADMVVSRAGANSLYELLLTRKPHILVPLTMGASRGDQLVNAATFESEGMSLVIREDQFTGEQLLSALDRLIDDVDIRAHLAEYKIPDATEEIIGLIQTVQQASAR